MESRAFAVTAIMRLLRTRGSYLITRSTVIVSSGEDIIGLAFYG
jgi:hypothetical protein